jgi:hypothetical protein
MITATKIGENRYHVKIGEFTRNVGAGNKPAAIAQVRQALYLDWVNDWLTTAAMSEHYNLPQEYLRELLEQEREKHYLGG